MMIIRDANISDIPGIERCARDFFEYAKFEDSGLPFDANSFNGSVSQYITSQDAVIKLLINDDGKIVGGIAGHLSPWQFNRDIKMAIEFFYWIDPEYRGISAIKLYKAYEKEIKSLGAKFSIMISVKTGLEKSIEKMYNRLNYKPFENFYLKEL